MLTAKQCAARLKFAKQYKNLSAEEWDDFLFSDTCPNYLFQLPNPKNDMVWGSQESQAPPAYQVKKSSKWIIWGGMTGCGLTGIYFLPQGQTLTAGYYINNILAELWRAKRARGAPWVSKSTNPRKIGNHVTVQRPPARCPSVRTTGKSMFNPTLVWEHRKTDIAHILHINVVIN